MAVRAKTHLSHAFVGEIDLIRWTGLTKTTDDTGAPLTLGQYADRSVQARGTFGSGGKVIMEGSNDLKAETPTYAPLVDPNGNAIEFSAAGIEQILECSYLIRPRVTAGDGTTDLTVTLMVRK